MRQWSVVLFIMLASGVLHGQVVMSDSIPGVSGPSFPGGEEALQVFVEEHVDRSVMDQFLDLNGTVYVSVVVTADGQLVDARIMRGVCPSYDAEALRLVQHMPRWIPRTVDGVTQRVEMLLPLRMYRK